MSAKRTAELRVCGSCEWVFKMTHSVQCPRCGFGSYGAHAVYGYAAYKLAKSQKYWIKKQLIKAEARIAKEAKEVPCCYTATHTRGFHHDSKCVNHLECY